MKAFCAETLFKCASDQPEVNDQKCFKFESKARYQTQRKIRLTYANSLCCFFSPQGFPTSHLVQPEQTLLTSTCHSATKPKRKTWQPSGDHTEGTVKYLQPTTTGCHSAPMTKLFCHRSLAATTCVHLSVEQLRPSG